MAIPWLKSQCSYSGAEEKSPFHLPEGTKVAKSRL